MYYPSIDGLRAVAVVSVVLYHLNAGWLNGGFIGVDVFFVISGFVVSLAMANVTNRSFASFMTYFYARRLLRIAPALIVCLTVTVMVSCLFIPRAWLSDGNRATGLAAFVGLSNLVLARPANDYFSPRAEFNPFTHTWSLAVEEQFYLVFPLLMYFFLKSDSNDFGRRASRWALALLTLASLACSAWWTIEQPTRAFYLTPSRFWELGVGVGLFMTREHWSPFVARMSVHRVRAVAWTLLLLLAVSLLTAQARAFPFPWALAPVSCTAGLIALIVGHGDGHAIPAMLRNDVAVWIGKISYSLYLWHWPVFVLLRWTSGIDTIETRAAGVSMSFILAALSYRFVELPTRTSSTLRHWPRAGVVAVGLASVVGATALAALAFEKQNSLSVSVTSDRDAWLPDGGIEPPGALPKCRVQFEWRSLEGGTVQTFIPTACAGSGGKGRLFVAGDSHAWGYSALLRLYSERSGREVRLITKGGCSLFDLLQPMAGAGEDCRRFSTAALRDLSASLTHDDVLFLPSLRVVRFRDQWGGEPVRLTAAAAAVARDAALSEAIDFLQTLDKRGVRIVLEAPKPLFRAPPFRCADWFNRGNPICAPGFVIDRAEMERVRASAVASLNALIGHLGRATLWDPLPLLCDHGACAAFDDGRPIYFDGDHLSGLGNARLLNAFKAHVEAAMTAAPNSPP